jgi:homoserine O-acetyltransferase
VRLKPRAPDTKKRLIAIDPFTERTLYAKKQALMSSAPLQQYKQAPTRDAADKLFDNSVRAQLASADANNLLYAVDASRDYDPAPKLESIKAPLVAVNSADDQINPPELGIVEREIKRVKRGRYVLIPISDQTRGHGTHSLPELWKQYLAELLAQSTTAAQR